MSVGKGGIFCCIFLFENQVLGTIFKNKISVFFRWPCPSYYVEAYDNYNGGISNANVISIYRICNRILTSTSG